jgi:hypothetical protein
MSKDEGDTLIRREVVKKLVDILDNMLLKTAEEGFKFSIAEFMVASFEVAHEQLLRKSVIVIPLPNIEEGVGG